MGCGLSKQGNVSPASSKSSFSSDIDSVSSSDKRNGIKKKQKKLMKKRNRNQVHNQNRQQQNKDQSKPRKVSDNGHGRMHLPTIYVNPPTPVPPQRTEPKRNIMHHYCEDSITDTTADDHYSSVQTPAQTDTWLQSEGEHSVQLANDQIPGIVAANFLPDGSLVILDKKNNSVKHYSHTFSFLSEYKLSSQVVGMCSTHERIFVALQHAIHALDVKEQELTQAKVIDISAHIHAIAAGAEQLLIVISTDKLRQIQHLDLEGNVITTDDLKTPGESALSPEHMCVLDTGDILVANEFDSAVYVKRKGKAAFEATGIHFNHINGITSYNGGILVAGHDYVTQNVLRKYDCSSGPIRLLGSVKKDDIGFVPWGMSVRNVDKCLITGGFQDVIKSHVLLD